MLKSMIVVLAIFGSVAAQAKGYDYYAIQDHKAVAGYYSDGGGAIQDHKAVGLSVFSAVVDQKAVSIESQTETAQLLDLNEGF